MFKSVLIANRGEIACRVIKTARRLGVRTIAVYSQADSDALHVNEADEAHFIGSSEAAHSYLRGEKILQVAKASGAECLHPGYGFLAENADFAEACAKAGVTFVGPPAAAIRAMGLKDAAKSLMEKAGVPVVPGYHGKNQDSGRLAKEAQEIGYPVLIKAVAGGGGKGMRLVENKGAFAAALESCRREASNAFGDNRVLVEKFVAKPRHIEIQVFADIKGTTVYLYERDCSLQRRHQKVIEEAPAPGLGSAMREAMGEAAVAAAEAVGYVGAGTVEFIADASKGLDPDAFYFMEMNTRLQVEHPVTEMVTGLDLVELQLRVAAGEPLGFTQSDLEGPSGHAIEARLYAEDPASGFLPQTGNVHYIHWPRQDIHVRIDTGVAEGAEISPYYDPMVAKVIAWGRDRGAALQHLTTALARSRVLGLRTNLNFLRRAATHPEFIAGVFDTGFIDANIGELVTSTLQPHPLAACALTWMRRLAERASMPDYKVSDEIYSPWDQRCGWTLGGNRTDRLHLLVNGEPVQADISWGHLTSIDVAVGEETWQIHVGEHGWDGNMLHAVLDDVAVHAGTLIQDQRVLLQVDGIHFEVRAQHLLAVDEEAVDGSGLIRAPMSGKLLDLFVSEGVTVAKGDRLAVLEAMKMEHSLNAGMDARVTELGATAGDQVDEGQVLIVLEALDEG